MELNDPEENYRTGYISIFRSIRNHWVFENDKYFKWWVIILMEANHSERKMTLGYKLYDINIGQSSNSLRTWSNLFNTGVKQVVKFFDLLESDRMITRKTIGKGKQSTTLITIENYTQYQGKRETQETTQRTTQGKRNEPHEGGTNNNYNNYNNSNNSIKEKESVFNFKKEFLDLGVEKEILEDWLKVRKTKRATNSKTAFNGILNQIEGSGLTANECIKISAENSWSGFNKKWIEEKEKSSAKKEKLNVTQRVFGEYYEEAAEMILNASHKPEYKKIS